MRNYLNGILSFIGAESLTDEEFSTITLDGTTDDVANYEALLGVLKSRDLVSESISRLQAYYKAMGVSIPPTDLGVSNIFIGSVL